MSAQRKRRGVVTGARLVGVAAAWLALAVPALAASPATAAAPGSSAAAAAGSSGAATAPGTSGAATAPGGSAAAEAPEQPTMRDDRDVLDSSEKWLRLIDRGQFGAAWDISAAYLKAQVTRTQWEKGIGDARKPFGALKARKADRFARAHEMPGAPEGDYAIVQFETDFVNGKHATEQLTWMLEPDGGIWRVSGYYIR